MFETLPTKASERELDHARLCRVVADVDDAAARNALGALRVRLESVAEDRTAAFGAMMSRSKNEDRFRAFRDDERSRPLSIVGPLGTCIVYSDWKIAQQREVACRSATGRLAGVGGDASLLRYADALFQWRTGDVSGALATVGQALVTAPRCEALLLLKARLTVASGADVAALKKVWSEAESAMTGCFSCATELGKLIEGTDGKAAAAGAWERALKAVPDHPETLRRLAAAVSGVDDARALAAYAAAVDAGARDFPTLLAAARLASSLAQSPADVKRALDFARRTVEVGGSDPDARRLAIDLGMRAGDLPAALASAKALVELAPDDLLAHAALARGAVQDESLAEAALHYEVVSREAAAGRTAGVDAATLQTLAAERLALLAQLGIDDTARAAGGPATIAQNTQRTLTKLWRKRLEAGAVKSGGVMTVVVETASDGHVVEVVIKADPFNDKILSAAAVAALRRTTISGGAKRYTLDFTLE
jgi:hypothetical protein